MLSKFVQQLRKKRGFTQEHLASALGVSRPTYIQIERGERDLTLTEAEKLASIFGISFEDFRRGEDFSITAELKKEKTAPIRDKQNIRINIPQKNLKKFTSGCHPKVNQSSKATIAKSAAIYSPQHLQSLKSFITEHNNIFKIYSLRWRCF